MGHGCRRLLWVVLPLRWVERHAAGLSYPPRDNLALKGKKITMKNKTHRCYPPHWLHICQEGHLETDGDGGVGMLLFTAGRIQDKKSINLICEPSRGPKLGTPGERWIVRKNKVRLKKKKCPPQVRPFNTACSLGNCDNLGYSATELCEFQGAFQEASLLFWFLFLF